MLYGLPYIWCICACICKLYVLHRHTHISIHMCVVCASDTCTYALAGSLMKHTPRALEAIGLGFEPNISAWYFFIQEQQTLWVTNQVKFAEYSFPFRRRSTVYKFQNRRTHMTSCTRIHHRASWNFTTSCISAITRRSTTTW